MTKYIFILGKNWHLSLAEIDHCLQKNEFRGRILDYSACAAIVEFEQGEVKEDKIAKLQFLLGGTQKIAQAVEFIDYETFLEAFPQEISDSVHPGVMIDARKKINGFMEDSVYPIFGRIDKKTKYLVANSIYPIEFRSNYYRVLVQHFLHYANKFWVRHLKEKGARNALYYRYPEEYISKGFLNPIFPHHFVKYELYKPNRKEVIYTLTEEGMYIGYTLNVSNSNEMKMIDEERPYINYKASIPPKFAKMMINFLNLKQPFNTMRILDPFCGSGTILMFAYALGVQVYGSDISEKAVKGTRKNLEWMQDYLEKPTKLNLKNQIVKCDVTNLSEKFNNMKFHGIVSEPILVPYFKDIPEYNKLNDLVMDEIIPKYKAALEEFSKILRPKGRVCIISPSIETYDGGKIRIDLRELTKDLGYKNLSILNYRSIQEKSSFNLKLRTRKSVTFDGNTKFLQREFYLFEKK